MPASETATSRLVEHLDSLPIFPLAEAVLFPRSVLPLHIFEPRYREMVRDAREAGLPIAIAMQKPGEVDPLGRPAVRPVAGAGFIQASEQLPDGRYLIELAGVARVRVVREHPPERAYRRVAATLLQQAPTDPAVDAARLETLWLILTALQSSHPRAAASLVNLVRDRKHPGEVADLLASAVVADAQRRQLLLEELDPIARIDQIIEHLGEVLARLRGSRDATDLN